LPKGGRTTVSIDVPPPDAGVEPAGHALTDDTLITLVDNDDYQELALLYVAAKLKLGDALRDGPLGGSVLAEACGAHPVALHTVLRGLASLGLLTHTEDGSFGLTPLGHRLRTDTADSVSDQVVLEWEVLKAGRDGLLQAVRTGKPGVTHVFGHSLFEHLAENPTLGRMFDAHMEDLTKQAAASLLEVYEFGAAARIVDVGGGTGAMLAHILAANPDARGVVIEVPAVAEAARQHLAAVGLTSRCEVAAGDFFQEVPAGDTFLLSHVLHNWDDEHCLRILRNCRDAMTPDGRVVVFECVMPERISKPEEAVRADVAMLALTGGRERTRAEYRNLLAAAGLTLTRVVPTASPRSVLEAKRAAP
jgi:precorrin-6B methylase 2